VDQIEAGAYALSRRGGTLRVGVAAVVRGKGGLATCKFRYDWAPMVLNLRASCVVATFCT
jgi:hypothetical protein